MIDWRFDEHDEEAWEEPQRPLPPQPKRITRRRMLLLLLLLLLLSSVGVVLARQVDQQVLANIRAVQAEVQYTFDRTFVTIYDFTSGRPQTITFAGMPHGRFDWSPDERWLVTVQDRALRLIAPAYEFEQVVPLPVAGCETAVWMEQ